MGPQHLLVTPFQVYALLGHCGCSRTLITLKASTYGNGAGWRRHYYSQAGVASSAAAGPSCVHFIKQEPQM